MNKRRFNNDLYYVAEYERKIVTARLSLQTIRMLDKLLEKHPDLFENRSHVIEASIRRLYYKKIKG